ncbi:hypothetical protein BANRA_02589 [Acinetobacter baumannii]|nr:hypothetical protein BANRA_02589 [Acinetobacter baumannii]
MLDGTAKRWGLVGKEVFDTGKAAEAAAKYLNFLFKSSAIGIKQFLPIMLVKVT